MAHVNSCTSACKGASGPSTPTFSAALSTAFEAWSLDSPGELAESSSDAVEAVEPYSKETYMRPKWKRPKARGGKKIHLRQANGIADDACASPPRKSTGAVFKTCSKPQVKAFQRVSNDLYCEKTPLESEMRHEAATTFTLKSEKQAMDPESTSILIANARDGKYVRERAEDTWRRSRLIAKANQSWNTRNSPAASGASKHAVLPARLKLKRKIKPIDLNENLQLSLIELLAASSIDSSTTKQRAVSPSSMRAVSSSPSLMASRGPQLFSSSSEDLPRIS